MGSTCKRVNQRIECPECGYPASEAMYMLEKWLGMTGDTKPEFFMAREPITGKLIADPGHTQTLEEHAAEEFTNVTI